MMDRHSHLSHFLFSTHLSEDLHMNAPFFCFSVRSVWLVYMANIQCLDILPQKAKTKSDCEHSQCGWWSKQFLLFFFHDITQIITILPWWWWWNSVFLINYAGANVCASLSVPMSLSPWHMRPITCVKQKVDVKDAEDNIDIHTTVNLLICACACH